ncbi:MAG: hypothetical protein ACI4TK_18115 [Agathobacter sp.]
MVNQNDIFTALQNGEDPQVLANSFADALNAAIKQKAEADAKAAEEAKAKKRAESIRQDKLDYAAGIIEDVMDFLEEFYPDIYDEDLRKAATEHPEMLVDAFDQAEAEVKRMRPLFDELERLVHALDSDSDGDKNMKPTPRPMRSVNPIEDFLKMNGLKN